ncbi:MAG: Ycf66 family protein [Prochlorotrichaceae cyanobacterium]
MLSPTLSSVLAIVVALASLFLFFISFLAPRLYRAQDLWWSGVGMFYALVLWFCSAQIRGAVLLGTIASVSLLGWLSSQVYLSRWATLTEAEKAGGAIKRLQALGRQLTRLLESSPAEPREPKASKVRWVRPEKPTPAEPSADPLAEDQPESPDSTVAAVESASLEQALEPEDQAQIPPESSPDQPETPAETQPITEPFTPEDTTTDLTKTLTDELEALESSAEEPEADEWDDMETDLAAEDPEDKGTTATQVPAAPSMNVFKRVQNFFQGRKSHGKRFVRPEDEDPQAASSPSSTEPIPPTDPVPQPDAAPQVEPPEAELEPDIETEIKAEISEEPESPVEIPTLETLNLDNDRLESEGAPSPEAVTEHPSITAPDFSPEPQPNDPPPETAPEAPPEAPRENMAEIDTPLQTPAPTALSAATDPEAPEEDKPQEAEKAEETEDPEPSPGSSPPPSQP